MSNTKTLLAAASLAVAMAASAGAASAAPWDHRDDARPVVRYDVQRHDLDRRIVDRTYVFETLRLHHYRWLGDPLFVRGHYVVKVEGRFGRPLFVEVDPYTGALIGEFRI